MSAPTFSWASAGRQRVSAELLEQPYIGGMRPVEHHALPRVHFADWELPHWVELLADQPASRRCADRNRM